MPVGKICGLLAAVDGPDELRRCGEHRVGRVDFSLSDEAQHGFRHPGVPQGLIKPVADHALRLRAEDVERVRVRQ